MSSNKKNQSKLHSFFKPMPPPAASSSPSPRETPSASSSQVGLSISHKTSGPAHTSSSSGSSKDLMGSEKAIMLPASDPTKNISTENSFTSSLSPPPSSSQSEILQPAVSSTFDPSTTEVRGSDEEDDSDSDDSLEDLSTLMSRHRPADQIQTERKEVAPSTPIRSKTTRATRFQTSPLPVLPKYRFDLKSLARHAQKDDATEASMKRVKAMPTSAEEDPSDHTGASQRFTMPKISRQSELLESVVAEKEGGEVRKVARALDRTEATLPEFRWYFFKTNESLSTSERTPFPVDSLSKEWKMDLEDPVMRHQTLVSGFAEDVIDFGKTLPDEILLWMIDELCLEPEEVLRKSYSNILFASRVQVGRLMTDSVFQRVFQHIGATPTAINLTTSIQPVQEIIDPYGRQDWAKLRSVLGLLGQMSKYLLPPLRIQTICTLLRMGVDRVVLYNVDLYVLVQETITQICEHVPDDVWEESFCRSICEIMFHAVEQPTFRLKVVETLPSSSPKIHDLRRRLAMCFYFDDVTYGMKHCHYVMDLNLFIARLDNPVFDTNPETDYRELAALIQLLDIAVDDARSVDMDLTDRKTEAQFDDDIETFAMKIKDIIRGIGIPGPGFISKIEAKEVLELVSQRISGTLRSRPKPKQSIWIATGRSDKELAGEKDLMKKFLARSKDSSKDNSGNATPDTKT